MGGGGGGTKQDFQASMTAAGTALSQQQDYIQRFVPYQEKLIKTIDNPELAAANQGFARSSVAQAFDTQRGAQGRDLARLGTVMTPQQQGQAAQNFALNQSSQTVAGLNAARLHTRDSNLAIMAGGMGDVRNRVTTGQGAY